MMESSVSVNLPGAETLSRSIPLTWRSEFLRQCKTLRQVRSPLKPTVVIRSKKKSIQRIVKIRLQRAIKDMKTRKLCPRAKLAKITYRIHTSFQDIHQKGVGKSPRSSSVRIIERVTLLTFSIRLGACENKHLGTIRCART